MEPRGGQDRCLTEKLKMAPRYSFEEQAWGCEAANPVQGGPERIGLVRWGEEAYQVS